MAAEPVVFVVDDDEAARDSLHALFEAHGFDTESFASAFAFLERLTSAATGCLVTDVRMPGMDGLELVLALKEREIELPVVVITGHGDVPLAVRAMKAGARDFIEKPFDESVIVNAVRQAIASRATSEDGGAAAELRQRIARLTPRERDVLDQLVLGHANKVIAYELGISPRTVEIHRARLMDKMGARSLSELVRMAVTAGL